MKNILRQASYFFGGMGAVAIMIPVVPAGIQMINAGIQQQNADTLALIEKNNIGRNEQLNTQPARLRTIPTMLTILQKSILRYSKITNEFNFMTVTAFA